jgi:hypothetical protein
MKQKPFLLIVAVLIGVIIYAYYAPKESPEWAATLTPKQYIELVEQKKQERKAQAAEAAKLEPVETPQK